MLTWAKDHPIMTFVILWLLILAVNDMFDTIFSHSLALK